MTDLSSGFSAPLNVARTRGARLIEGFSPKLRRRIQFFDHANFAQWIRLEADPGVQSLCERPTRVSSASDARVVDFWVRRAAGAELVAVEGASAAQLPDVIGELPVRIVRRADLAAAAVWIDNWTRMLPVINATRAMVPTHLLKAIRHGVRRPEALGLLEHEFSVGDPSLVRGAIFELLRLGQLVCPRLHVERLSMHTVIEAAP